MGIMKKRSIYQLKNDLSRINLDGKSSLKKKQDTIKKQYEKQGKAIPKKLNEGRATVKDLKNYFTTLLKNLDVRIDKREQANENDIIRGIKQFNQLEEKRYRELEKNLEGYDKNIIKGLANGQLITVGRGVVASLPKIEKLSLDRLKEIATNDGVSIKNALKFELRNARENLKSIKNGYDNKAIANKIKNMLEYEGLYLTDKQYKQIVLKLSQVDMLGQYYITKVLYDKIENSFYSAYKEELKDNNNRQLMESIFNDLNKASHNRLTQYARIIDM